MNPVNWLLNKYDIGFLGFYTAMKEDLRKNKWLPGIKKILLSTLKLPERIKRFLFVLSIKENVTKIYHGKYFFFLNAETNFTTVRKNNVWYLWKPTSNFNLVRWLIYSTVKVGIKKSSFFTFQPGNVWVNLGLYKHSVYGHIVTLISYHRWVDNQHSYLCS